MATSNPRYVVRSTEILGYVGNGYQQGYQVEDTHAPGDNPAYVTNPSGIRAAIEAADKLNKGDDSGS